MQLCLYRKKRISSPKNTQDIYNGNSMRNHYNRLMRIYNDITAEETGLQSALEHIRSLAGSQFKPPQ